LENSKWPDMLPRVIQARVVESLENAKYTNVLAGTPDGKQFEFQLMIEIRRFQISAGAAPHAVVTLAARLLDKDGGIVGVKTFEADVAAQSLDPSVAVKALNEAFGKVQKELVVWVCGTI
ncbi:MAG: ABC-type transport auxiliary lipoprotein family protein, partial [Hyphomicrobiaceae bacterium]